MSVIFDEISCTFLSNHQSSIYSVYSKLLRGNHNKFMVRLTKVKTLISIDYFIP